jgi:hypothetical protein
MIAAGDLSRLSCDQVESEQVIRRLRLECHGVRIVAVSDVYNSRTTTATRKIQRGVKNLDGIAIEVHDRRQWLVPSRSPSAVSE